MKTRYRHLSYIITVTICVFILLLIPESGISQYHEFCPGEKMTFEVKWSFIVAGEATLEIQPYKNIDGIPIYHFLFTAKTTSFVDVFYKVRDRMESFTNIDLTRSLRYNKLHKGKETTVEFDWEKKEARLMSEGNIKKSTQIENSTFDPLAVFYAFRIAQPDTNNEVTVHVTDGKRTVKGIAKIIKREKIKVEGKSYKTILFEPQMEGVGGIFEKSKDAKLKIWVTDDNLRIPVRIKSKVAVGSFVADLISYRPGSDDNYNPSGQEE